MLFFFFAAYLCAMKMKDWNLEEQPREKLLRRGAGALSHAELLAIFVCAGFPGRNALDIAQELLSSAGGRLTELLGRTPRKLMEHKGIGEARAVTITAALELGRRFMAEASAQRTAITSPEDVCRRMLPLLKGLDHEECWVLFLNRANHVTRQERLTSGTVDATLIDAKRVLRSAIEQQSKAVILVHNHPSGSPLPGEADIRETRQLQMALKAFNIALFDHVILSDGAYYSFQEERITKMGL